MKHNQLCWGELVTSPGHKLLDIHAKTNITPKGCSKSSETSVKLSIKSFSEEKSKKNSGFLNNSSK